MGERERVRRQRADKAEPDLAPLIVHEALASPGRPLDDETRGFMEPRFGHDFSQVRLHTDARAAESADAVSALAYTVGQDIVFGAGQYQPGTSEGRRLIAHELAHTVQQGRGGLSSHSQEVDLERGAEQASSLVIQGSGPIHVVGTSGMALARQPRPGTAGGRALAAQANQEYKDKLGWADPASTGADIALNIIGEIGSALSIFAIEAGSMLAGAVVSLVALVVALEDAERRQKHAGEMLGIRLGIVATDFLANEPAVPHLDARVLEERILASSLLAYSWNQQIRYAGSVHPDVIAASLRKGLRQVADVGQNALRQATTTYNHAKSQHQEKTHRHSLAAGEQSEIRRYIYRNLARAAREAMPANSDT